MVFWVMDLNPDEVIAAGWLKADSMTAKNYLTAVFQPAVAKAAERIFADARTSATRHLIASA
jgi:hypothetical protein